MKQMGHFSLLFSRTTVGCIGQENSTSLAAASSWPLRLHHACVARSVAALTMTRRIEARISTNRSRANTKPTAQAALPSGVIGAAIEDVADMGRAPESVDRSQYFGDSRA